MIYTTITNKIEDILNIVKADNKIAEIHSNPTTKIQSYPAAIFFPVSVENDFETNQENMKNYNFSLYLVCQATQSSINEVYNDILSNLNDAVLQAFDSGWDLDSIDGHRVWVKIESGDITTSTEQDGLIVDSHFSIQIKVLTNN